MADTLRQDPSRARLDRAIMAGRVIILALTASVVAYVVIGTLVVQAGAARSNAGLVGLGLATVGFFALVGSVTFRRINLAPLRLQVVYNAQGATGLVDHLMRTTIISAALGEIVGIAGLVLGILTGDARNMTAFCLVSLAAILLSLPRPNGWREAYESIVSDGGSRESGNVR